MSLSLMVFEWKDGVGQEHTVTLMSEITTHVCGLMAITPLLPISE
jgi:hypothetical protein